MGRGTDTITETETEEEADAGTEVSRLAQSGSRTNSSGDLLFEATELESRPVNGFPHFARLVACLRPTVFYELLQLTCYIAIDLSRDGWKLAREAFEPKLDLEPATCSDLVPGSAFHAHASFPGFRSPFDSLDVSLDERIVLRHPSLITVSPEAVKFPRWIGAKLVSETLQYYAEAVSL